MTLQDLIDEYRRVMSDAAAPYLLSDEVVTGYVNQAVDEACERALLIEDRSTPAVCQLTLVAGQANYPLHPSVIKVKRVARGRCVLTETSVEELDEECFGWETLAGQPNRYIHTGGDTLLVTRIPTADDVLADALLSLIVYRKPLVPLTVDNPDAQPEVKALYQPRLMPWVYRCAHLTRDSELYDPAEALRQEAIFDAAFGKRPDANVQRKRRDKRPPVVRMRF